MPTSIEGALKLADVPRADPLETIRRGSALVSSKVGIIKRLAHGGYRALDPQIFSMGIVAQDLSRVSGLPNSGKAGGAGETIESAMAATIGEAVERYCMLWWDKKEMIRASYADVRDAAIHPDELRLFSPDQPLAKRGLALFTEESTIRWVWGYSLVTRQPRLVPASFVYLNYRYDDDEARIGSNASNGLAASLTLEEAILNAASELVERDAFAIRWLHQMAGPRIEVDSAEMQRLLEERYHSWHPDVSIDLYDITLDVPLPCVFAVMRRPAEFGRVLCVGAACRVSAGDAIRKSLREAGQALSYYRYLMQQLATWEPEADFSDITSFDHHCMLYVKRPDLVDPAIAPWTRETRTIPLSKLPHRTPGSVLGDLQHCLGSLEKGQHDVIVVDITTSDVADVGFTVVRVIIPGLVPLHGTHWLPYIGARRFREVPERLGWPAARPGHEAVNPFPHPFP
jgi:ribosomal protein S12 methylthiotransferase accessory factor